MHPDLPTPLTPAETHHLAHRLGRKEPAAWIRVSAAQQGFVLEIRGRQRLHGPVSTSRHGLGNRERSFQTPRGPHRVQAWIGDGEPLGRVFEARSPTPERAAPCEPGHTDRICTRILRLEGLADGLNRGPGIDSFDRFIYLHGTNHEDRVGTPASQGCIRLRGAELPPLFDLTHALETWCWISRDWAPEPV